MVIFTLSILKILLYFTFGIFHMIAVCLCHLGNNDFIWKFKIDLNLLFGKSKILDFRFE